MHLGEPESKRTKRFIWATIGFFVLLFIVAFWNEIRWLFGVEPAPEDIENVLLPIEFIFFVCFGGFVLVALLWALLISFQALLPITDFVKDPLQSLIEAYRTARHLILYVFGQHGPAISVKDGQKNDSPEEVNRINQPGVVVVDFNSAVVLEEMNPPPGIAKYSHKAQKNLLEVLLLSDSGPSPRVCGPGIVFTRPRERIRGVVDLRKQFRLEPKVLCYTREGIELYASIFAIFTIGQDPDILQVTYVGEHRPENLRVVTLESKTKGLQRITGFNDELDEEDRKEIHAFMLRESNPNEEDRPLFEPYKTLDDTNKQKFDQDRVFSAVYAQARNDKQEVVPWDQLPTRVAAGLYREQLMQVNYDELYDIKEERTQFPLPDYKAKLRLVMRNNGILAFRFIKHPDRPLVKNQVYQDRALSVTQVRPLTNSKVLRDRGIKIILSSFGDLIPVNEAIYLQRFNTWRTAWERELEINQANHELEALRIRGRAHAQAQQDLWRSLRQIFDQRDFSDEAMALRILQALDQAAADPRTRALLPANTIDLLSRLQTILIPPVATPANPPPGQGGGP
jgi:hypothetical protein